METFPAFFPLADQRVVIAGEGAPAEAKFRLFDGSPAHLIRLSGEAAFEAANYAGATLAFVASWDAAFCERAAAAAREAAVPVNVADRPDLCDFHAGAIVDRGQVVAAVGTAGASPLLASLLRAELEARVPESAGIVAALLGEQRVAVREAFPDQAHRRAFLRALLYGPVGGAAGEGDVGRARGLLAEALDEARTGGFHILGRVSLIPAPPSPDLISLRAARFLAEADVVVAGDDVHGLLAHHGRRDAERLPPADASAEAIVALARRGRLVAVVGVAAEGRLADQLAELGMPAECLWAATAS